MLLVLSGAKKNVGDFLITDRVLRLIEHVLDEEVVVLPRWKPLEGNEELVERARAIVVAGGPGVIPTMYPDVFPLFKDPKQLARMRTPLRFLGVGWFAARGDEWEKQHFAFTDSTRRFLEGMGDLVSFSTRDKRTAEVLALNGVEATFTGCPVWYDLRHSGEPYKRPEGVRSVVFTTPQSALYEKQSHQVLARMMERLPDAKFYCTFHRGFEADDYTSQAEAERFKRMAADAEDLGAEVRDVSYGLENVAFYDDCDVHVGYRVHAHLQFLSGRRPSFLLEEDGRGNGFAEVIPAPSISAWDYTWYGRQARGILPAMPARVRRRLSVIEPSGSTLGQLDAAVEDFISGGDSPFSGTVETFEEMYPVMRRFIESI